MGHYTRKLQYVAGTTYSLSLPKQWVQNNKINIGDELNINEGINKTLTISQSQINQSDELTLNITNHHKDITQIIYSIYYLGVETIHIKHEQEFPRDIRLTIRKTISGLSGTEIIHEEKDRLTIKVLLDKSKIDIFQLFYRMHLIVDSELEEITQEASSETIIFYETEIDRLYHLSAKILKMSLVDTTVLASSKIENIQFIPGFFLLIKRLENISDNIEYIAKRMERKQFLPTEIVEPINKLRIEHKRNAQQLLRISKDKIFTTMENKTRKEIEKSINTISDEAIRIRLWEIQRFILNVQEELVSLTFYKNQYELN